MRGEGAASTRSPANGTLRVEDNKQMSVSNPLNNASVLDNGRPTVRIIFIAFKFFLDFVTIFDPVKESPLPLQAQEKDRPKLPIRRYNNRYFKHNKKIHF